MSFLVEIIVAVLFLCFLALGYMIGSHRMRRKIVTYDDLVDCETRCLKAEEEVALLTQSQDCYSIEPIEGQDSQGRHWGYRILKDGVPYIECVTGATGACWNIDDYDCTTHGIAVNTEKETIYPLHVCDLDDLIGALVYLKRSDVHKEQVERWS